MTRTELVAKIKARWRAAYFGGDDRAQRVAVGQLLGLAGAMARELDAAKREGPPNPNCATAECWHCGALKRCAREGK